MIDLEGRPLPPVEKLARLRRWECTPVWDYEFGGVLRGYRVKVHIPETLWTPDISYTYNLAACDYDREGDKLGFMAKLFDHMDYRLLKEVYVYL